jgi:HEPN domain-containing protein
MVNIDKQIAHWKNGALEDWDVAQSLVQQGKIRHGLFFAHLALEKQIKALVCKKTGQLAPPIHNLVRLAEKAALTVSDEQLDLLAEVNEFNIEGRYPELLLPLPTRQEAEQYMTRISEVLQCLNSLWYV